VEWLWCCSYRVWRGSWAVKDAVEALNWLPDGPIPTNVEWRLDGYERVSYGQVARAPALVQPTTAPEVVA